MSDYQGRLFGQRDLNLLASIDKELHEQIIQVIVLIYKVNPIETTTNIYGETDQSAGKVYFPPVSLPTRVNKDEITTPHEPFGSDRKQGSQFLFRQLDLMGLSFFPQVGDIIEYNQRFYEINSPAVEQYLGGIPDKTWSVVVSCHYTTQTKLNILPRQN